MRRVQAFPPQVIFQSIGIASNVFCCSFYDELLHGFALLDNSNKTAPEKASTQDIQSSENNIVLSYSFFIAPIMPPLFVSGIMLPLFSLPTTVLRRGKESCNISLSRTLLSVLGSLSTTGPLGQLVSYFHLFVLDVSCHFLILDV